MTKIINTSGIHGAASDLSSLYPVILVDISGNYMDITAGSSAVISGTSPITVTSTSGVTYIGISYTSITFEKPSGTIDGINKNFTLLHNPIINSAMIYENGIKLMPSGVYTDWDYTINSNNLNFTYPPASGSKIIADYNY